MKMFKHVYENKMLISIKNFMYAKYFNMHYACTYRSQSNSKMNPYFYLNIIYFIIKSQSNCKEELMCYLFPYILHYGTFKIHSNNVEWNCLLISHFKEKLAEYILFQWLKLIDHHNTCRCSALVWLFLFGLRNSTILWWCPGASLCFWIYSLVLIRTLSLI